MQERLQKQMAEIAKEIAPAISPEADRSLNQIRAVAATQLVESGALKGLQDPAAFANLAEMTGVAEKIRQLVATPEFRRFIEQQYAAKR